MISQTPVNEKKIGFAACINTLSRDLYEENKDRCVFASGKEAGKGTWCFVGLNTHDSETQGLKLTAGLNEWEYYASCYVNQSKVTMDKCRLPRT